MASDAEIEAKFWKDLKASPFLMLGLDGARDGHAQPMTAFFENEHGPIWFFTAKDNGLVSSLGQSSRAMGHFVAKGHDLFATIHGSLVIDNDAATIDRLWNSQVAAWFEGGRNDPKLRLLRLDTESAQIWLNASSIGAAIKRMFGRDPKADYQGKVAEVAL
jgi:general stress protein 26